MSETPDLERVRRLTLAPDDLVVIQTDLALSMDAKARLKAELEGWLGQGRKVAVLDRDLELTVVGPTRSEEEELEAYEAWEHEAYGERLLEGERTAAREAWLARAREASASTSPST